MKSSVLKKVLIVLGSLVGLILVAAIVIPLVVDVDHYRPQIEKAVNEHINGKFEIGKLKLSLWGRVRVEVGGLTLSGPDGVKILAVKDAEFHLPFMPILMGAPVVTLRMDHPAVTVISDKASKLNVMQLMKDAPATTPGTPPPADGSGDLQVPGIVARARMGIEMRGAEVVYRDLATGLDNQLKDVNLVAHDLSLSRPADIELWGEINTKLGKTMQVTGPARLKMTVVPTMKAGRIDAWAITFLVNLDDLEVLLPSLFHKKKGMAANITGKINTTPDSATLESIEAKFFNAVINAKGTVTDLSAPVVKFEMKSNDIDLAPWSELVPMLVEYKLGGKARFSANVQGASAKLAYTADLNVDALTATSPMLKAQPRIDAQVHVVTDQIEKMLITLKAPGNDLRVEGKVLSFTKPHIQATVTGGMDIDQLVKLPPLGEAPPVTAKGASGSPSAPPVDDYDAMVAGFKTNSILAATTGIVDVKMTFFQVYGVRMTDIAARKSLNNLSATIDPFSMRLFDGVVKATATVDLKPAQPSYRFTADVAGLELQKAVESQFKLFKNTVVGKASARMDGSGSSFNPETAKKNLNAKGTLKIVNAKFATIDVGRMASEAIEKAMGQLGNKIPALKGKEVKTPKNFESGYEFITSDFTISGGKFRSPNLVAKAFPDRGIDLMGSTTVGMIDYALDAQWMVIDTYNMLHAKDLNIEQGGVKVDGILAEGNGPVKFPVVVGCTALAPCYKYTEVPEYLIKVALKKATSGVKEKVKEEVKAEVKSKAKEKLKGLGKKLFGR